MSNKTSNFPTNSVNLLPAEKRAETMLQVQTLRELNAQGKPRTAQEFKDRFEKYFAYCSETGCAVGIETLALSINYTRQQFYNFCRGVNCDKETQDVCLQAKQFVIACTEQYMLQGKINPASAIFAMKNVALWRDTFDVHTTANETSETNTNLSLADIRQALKQTEQTD